MKKHLFNRLLSLVLAAVMVLGLFPAASASPAGLRWEKTDVDVSWDRSDRLIPEEIHGMTAHKPTDLVRVAIVLEDEPTLMAGYSTQGIGTNTDARAYDRHLQKAQEDLEERISAQALGGKELDVVWNLTLVGNIISANVPYGKLDAVRAVEGVRDVVIENSYEVQTAIQVDPNMYSAAGMEGATTVWQTGLTGAGTRIAIIDTGTDTDHQSFDNGAYLHALNQNAAKKGVSYEDYVASLDLLDADKIAGVLENLNVSERMNNAAEAFYINEKLPFGANYVDRNLVVDHDHDSQGSHGSHVAGIAAANRFIPKDGSYVDARQSVQMNGVAPDAQIITLKVFGNGDGPSDSDYFAAIEDAIWLGCDSINLSLGSGSPGNSHNSLFAELLEFMATTDTVVVMSAGNSGYWAENTDAGYLYSDGVSFQTDGEPGSYTNALTVASVDNDGTVGPYIRVKDTTMVYTESSGGFNRDMTFMDKSADGSGTEYPYVFIDGFGYSEDYNGMDLKDKVVFCSRGELSFYEIANNAAKLGAAAIVIYNNVSGPFGMNVSGYKYTVPCVSILQSEAAAVKAASEQSVTSEGVTYYTGTVTISRNVVGSAYHSDYYTMSAFSSWGVPGSLELKPEITAPGGNIWSVDGADSSGTSYEMMSGTSMAAPQVTGMAALVAEYIRANDLDEQTEMSVRHLAQSLLMSTAVPMRDPDSGEYYSILNQGAGLARVDQAVSAGSYLTVAGQPDGKVKAELGEDADRAGLYEFTFTINNLNGRAMTYELSAELFTQGLFGDEEGVLYLDTGTYGLGAEAAFFADGVSLENASEDFTCDLNGDGVTTAADADYLLEYLLGNVSALKADGDVNGDGRVNSYDAHVLLSRLSGEYFVDVPADGSVTINAVLELTEQTRAYLDTYYPTGAYIEGYVFAAPLIDSEGAEGVAHSIPVLGYYGSWTEPSMYDVGSSVEYESGAETRDPYLYAVNGHRINYVSVNYGDGEEYVFGGNPFTAEDAYLPERNAFNNQTGAVLQNLRFTQIRNAAASRLILENADTGERYVSEDMGAITGAYYHVNVGAWREIQNKLPLGLELKGIPEGTRLNLSLISAPEYYCTYDADGNVTADWDALDEGAWLTTSFTIDNTAPRIRNVELAQNNTLMITAQDNEYIAAVTLMNASDTTILAAAPANQTERGAEITCSLDLNSVFGKEFLVAVYDYAENRSVYKVTLELDNERPRFTAIYRNDLKTDDSPSYVGLDENTEQIWLADVSGRSLPRAVEYVEGAVFEITDDNKLYVGYDDDLAGIRYLTDLDPTGGLDMIGFADLAYNRADGNLYGLFYSDRNDQNVPYLCTIDLYNGQMTVLGEMPIDVNSLAIDPEGTFYSATCDTGHLYRYTASVISDGNVVHIGQLGGYGTTAINSMAWDHNTDMLYWMLNSDSGTFLVKIDPVTAQTELVTTCEFIAGGLYIAYESDRDLFDPSQTVSTVSVEESASTLAGNTVQLNPQVMPWNVRDNSVTWSTSDAGVATVNENGLVKGISAGTAVITATSVLDSSKSASCTVSVFALGKTLKAAVWDEMGDVWWSEFNTDSIPAYEQLANADLPVNATMMADGTLYASTLDVASGLSNLYTVDPRTFAMTKVGGSDTVGYLDMAYAPSLGYGLGVYFNYVVLIDLQTGEYEGAWEWTEGQASELIGITYYGTEYSDYYMTNMDIFLLLDSDGNVYRDAWIHADGRDGYFYGPGEGYVTNIGDPVDYDYFQGFHYDGEYVYWSRFNEADDAVELRAWDCDGTNEVYSLGYFPEGVWPVAGLYTDAQLTGPQTLVDETLSAASVKSVEMMTTIPTVELSGTVKGSLNAVSNPVPSVKPLGGGTVKDDRSVEVTFTVPEGEATNGIVTVAFDPAVLELTGVKGTTKAFAWKPVADGKVQFAFANGTALACDKLVALLQFSPLTEGETTIHTSFGEWNAGTGSFSEYITVNIPAYNPFTDVPEGSFYYEPVLWAVKNGVTTGATDTTFNPTGTCKRAQVVTFLWRAFGSQEPASTTNPFTDVTESDYFYKAVLWAVEKGITTGTSATEFSPQKECNRAQVVTFLWRAEGSAESTAARNPFSDVDLTAYYGKAVLWAVEEGITTGATPTTFNPTGICSRAQVVTFLYRALVK